LVVPQSTTISGDTSVSDFIIALGLVLQLVPSLPRILLGRIECEKEGQGFLSF